MGMPERVEPRPRRLADLRAELGELDRLLEALDADDTEHLRAAYPELQRRLTIVAELAVEFARGLDLWADPETQANLRALEGHIASGEPLAGVPIDQVITEIERRRTDLGA